MAFYEQAGALAGSANKKTFKKEPSPLITRPTDGQAKA
jgi:hypothetical protein